MNFKAILDDQHAFNQQIWDKNKGDEQATIARLKDLVLGMVEESLEFIRTYDFKVHRRRSDSRLQNMAHSHEELVDMFKYWLSIADAADFPFDQLEEMYYAKSRVVQYRYQEEWLKTLMGPSVVVDIDQVLGDYITGICRWGRQWGQSVMKLSVSQTAQLVHTMDGLQRKGQWVDATSLGVTQQQWQLLKHDFRTRGGKRTLPVFRDAKPFLEWCRSKGWTIILVTSRPIDTYPNLFTDTLVWLEQNHLPYDHVWWATEKAERIEDAHIVMRSQIVFAVDDGMKFVNQFRSKGVRAFHLDRFAHEEKEEDRIYTLLDIAEKLKEMDHVI